MLIKKKEQLAEEMSESWQERDLWVVEQKWSENDVNAHHTHYLESCAHSCSSSIAQRNDEDRVVSLPATWLWCDGFVANVIRIITHIAQ